MLFPVRDENGKMDSLTVVTANSTQRKLVEQEKTRLEAQLRQAQKMEAVGRLAGGVAHDFNNMLSLIIGHAEMAMEELDPSHRAYADLEQIRKAGERSTSLTRQLLAFASKQTIAPKVLDVNENIEGMLKMLRRLMGENIDLEWLPGQAVHTVKMDPSQLDQILANLCVNARDAFTDGGKVVIKTENKAFNESFHVGSDEFPPGEYVLIVVSDNGQGMDAETLENIFEPFFTTKGMGKGTGLGLATVYGVVQQNHGFVHVYSEPGRGATFNIYLPRYQAKAELRTAIEMPSRAEHGHETILLVEDEPSILKMTRSILRKLGYQVLAAESPAGALQLARQFPGELHLLVTDVVMPEMDGRELAREILALHPNLRHLFMSGYPADIIADHGVLDDGVNFIHKPFSRKDLGNKVREVLDGAPKQVAS
jgi:signal transduction histidine kinase/ActR/RegA family two-component response regulator